MGILHSKHQKLILQCYPPGKSPDKKPNPLELSYLLYYASTRRVKLEKVINYLARKTKSDASHNRSGNLQVTLSIVSALIDKCSNNLNVFALQVCTIMMSIVGTRELPLVKLAVRTYGVLCQKLDGDLFSGDKEFVDLYCQVTEELVTLGVSKLTLATPNTLEWRRVSLTTARHVFNCVGFNGQVSKKFLALCVPLLADQVHALMSHDTLLSRLNSNLNVDKDNDRRLSKVATGKSTKSHHVTRTVDPDALTDDDLNEDALAGLKTLFNTTLSSQISEATKEVVEHNLKVYSDDEEWGTTFLGMCASWIPVQLRFITLLTLLRGITSASEQVSHGDNGTATFNRMVHFAKNILGLVSSDFSMIGLSITDVIQRLLSLQSFLHFSAADHLEPEKVAYLSGIYSSCICNLSSHVYYFDQALDSIETILVHIDNLLISATAVTVDKVAQLVLKLLGDISIILNLLSLNSSAIIRNRATIEIWDVTLQLLSFSMSYKEFLEYGTQEQIIKIQTKYLQVFNTFLTKELVDNISPEENDNKAGDFDKLLQPNFNDYLENSQNVLSQLLGHSNDFFDDPQMDLEVAAQLVKTLRLVLLATGVNFIHNFLPFFQHWQLTSVSQLILDRAKDTAAYLLLQDLVTVIVTKYEGCFEGDVTQLDLAKLMQEDVASRRETGQWVAQIDQLSEPSELTTETGSGELRANVNRRVLHEFFSRISLHGWTAHQRASQLATRDDDFVQDNSSDYRGGYEHSLDEGIQSNQLLHPKPSSGGLGLGTVSDISSIHSGLINHSLRTNGLRSADITQTTNETLATLSIMAQDYSDYRLSLIPRVPELRSILGGAASPRSGGALGHENGTPRSVLEKQILTTDMSSILDGLTSDDDNEIIV